MSNRVRLIGTTKGFSVKLCVYNSREYQALQKDRKKIIKKIGWKSGKVVDGTSELGGDVQSLNYWLIDTFLPFYLNVGPIAEGQGVLVGP